MAESNPNREISRPMSRKMATWLGVVCGAVMVMVLLVLSLWQGHREHMKYDCGLQLRNIGRRCRIYAAEHNGVFPGKWSELEWNDLDGIEDTTWDRLFVCPMSGRPVGKWGQVDGWFTYRLIPGRTTNDQPGTVLAIELLSDRESGGNVLFVDGSSTWWSASLILSEKATAQATEE